METKAQDHDARKDDEKIPRPVAPVETEAALREENQPRQQQGRLPVLNSIFTFAGVVAVVLGVWVAKDTLNSINDQLRLSREQFTANRDALQLEQRAWLRYAGFTLQSLSKTASSSDPWENREISDSGDIARFRVSVVNSGRTPALNVTLSMGNFTRGVLGVPDFIFERPEETEWLPTEPQSGVVIMPGEQGRYLYTPPLPLHPNLVEYYMKGSLRIFLWTRLQYCDIYQRRHWALIAVARPAGSSPDSHFTIPEQHFGPADGEPNHAYCQNIVQDAP